MFTHPPGAVAFDFGPELGGEGVFGCFEGIGGFPITEDDRAGGKPGGLGDVEDGGFGDSNGFDQVGVVVLGEGVDFGDEYFVVGTVEAVANAFIEVGGPGHGVVGGDVGEVSVDVFAPVGFDEVGVGVVDFADEPAEPGDAEVVEDRHEVAGESRQEPGFELAAVGVGDFAHGFVKVVGAAPAVDGLEYDVDLAGFGEGIVVGGFVADVVEGGEDALLDEVGDFVEDSFDEGDAHGCQFYFADADEVVHEFVGVGVDGRVGGIIEVGGDGGGEGRVGEPIVDGGSPFLAALAFDVLGEAVTKGSDAGVGGGGEFLAEDAAEPLADHVAGGLGRPHLGEEFKGGEDVGESFFESGFELFFGGGGVDGVEVAAEEPVEGGAGEALGGVFGVFIAAHRELSETHGAPGHAVPGEAVGFGPTKIVAVSVGGSSVAKGVGDEAFTCLFGVHEGTEGAA